MKHLAKLLIIIFTLVAAQFDLTAAEGVWTTYGVNRGYMVSDMLDTPNTVYYISGTKLNAYDKRTGTVKSFSPGDNMLGTNVKKMAWCDAGAYLAVISTDSAIDFIDEAGNVTPMHDIRNLSYRNSKEVNDVCFDGVDPIFSTDFGVVKIDKATNRVATYGMYSQGAPTALTVANGRIYGIWGSTLYGADSAASLRSFSAFKPIGDVPAGSLVAVADHELLLTPNTADKLVKITVAPDNSSLTTTDIAITPLVAVWRGGDKLYTVSSDATIYDISNPSAPVSIGAVPTAVVSALRSLSAHSSSPDVWFATPSGICAYNLAQSATTPSVDSFLPKTTADNATNVANLSFLRTNQAGNRVWASTRGSSTTNRQSAAHYNPEVWAVVGESAGWSDVHAFANPSMISMLEGGKVTDRTVYNPLNHVGNNNLYDAYYYTAVIQLYYDNVIVGLNGVDENPNHPGEIWVATDNEGLYKINPDGSHSLFCLDMGNSQNNGGWGEQFSDCIFDPEGNLWVLAPSFRFYSGTTRNPRGYQPQMQMLPAEKVNGDPSAITWQDWLMPTFIRDIRSSSDYIKLDYLGDGRFDLMPDYLGPGSGSHLILSRVCDYNSLLGIYVRNSKDASIEDDYFLRIQEVRDQQDKPFNLLYTWVFKGDRDGRLWICNRYFIGYVDDMTQIQPGVTSLKAHRLTLKGTDGASPTYLLSHVTPTAMAQTLNGDIWIGTESSGLYRLNREANEILDHFTPENSPLPSLYITDLAADYATGSLYVSTREGLLRYDAEGLPATSLDDVRVTPAPVPAGYTGWFEINNLIPGTVINIVDSKGNVLHTATLSGASHTWDGLDANGSRVKAGTYRVLNAADSAVIAKIVIVD